MDDRVLLKKAIAHHEAGHLAQAEVLYRQVPKGHPDRGDALNLLGVLSRQRGNTPDAVRLIQEALSINASAPDFHFNLAEAYRALGRNDEAVEEYQAALRLGGPDAEVLHALGLVYRVAGKTLEATETLRRATETNPRLVPVYADLTCLLIEEGSFDEAVRIAQRAADLFPTEPTAHFSVGAALAACGLGGAADAYRRALELRPQWPEACVGLAAVLLDAGQSAEAVVWCRRALQLQPEFIRAKNLLGVILDLRGLPSEASALLEDALRTEPCSADLWGNLATALQHRGLHARAERAQRKAVELSGGEPVMQSNLLLLLNYCDTTEESALAAEHASWGRSQAERVVPFPQLEPNSHGREYRRLRVGYVSPDFRQHSVCYFISPILASHDPARVQAFVYSDVRRPDRVTERLRQLPVEWRDTRVLTDRALAELVREDRIDILVDLAGHTSGNRLGAFAYRPAPVQVTYLGYPNTTGLPRERLQYRLTDSVADPDGVTDELHSEQLFRLPGTFLCYSPPEDAPPVSPAPLHATGKVTLGSFNAYEKLTPVAVQCWSEILRRTPGSRLLLKCKSLNDSILREMTCRRFDDEGIAPERLLLAGPDVGTAAHLSRYAEVDIALDTFPYNGTTTTCEALRMGVPVITLAGRAHRSRVGASLLNAMGLSNLITTSPTEYVDTAIALASDTRRLSLLRAENRERLRRSPLMQNAAFTFGLENAFFAIWWHMDTYMRNHTSL